MKKLLILIIVLFTIPAYVFAQEKKIPESAIKELTEVLSKFQQDVAAAQKAYQEEQRRGIRWDLPPGQFPQALMYDFEITKATKIRAGATPTGNVLISAEAGTKYKIVDKMPEWYALDVAGTGVGGLTTGWVHASAGVPVVASVSKIGGITGYLIEKAIAVREYFRNNEYFYVKGFTLTGGISPSVSLNFEFK